MLARPRATDPAPRRASMATPRTHPPAGTPAWLRWRTTPPAALPQGLWPRSLFTPVQRDRKPWRKYRGSAVHAKDSDVVGPGRGTLGWDTRGEVTDSHLPACCKLQGGGQRPPQSARCKPSLGKADGTCAWLSPHCIARGSGHADLSAGHAPKGLQCGHWPEAQTQQAQLLGRALCRAGWLAPAQERLRCVGSRKASWMWVG